MGLMLRVIDRSDPLNRVRKMCLAHQLVFCVRTCPNVLKRFPFRRSLVSGGCLRGVINSGIESES